MKRQSKIIVVLVLCLLTLAIGYYIFKVNVDVKEDHVNNKDLEVIFKEVKKNEQAGGNLASAIISKNDKNLFIYVPDLSYVGSYASFLVTIKNTGSLPARLSSINEYGINNNGYIKISYDDFDVFNKVLEPGQEEVFGIKVTLKKNINNKIRYDFVINMNYVQG